MKSFKMERSIPSFLFFIFIKFSADFTSKNIFDGRFHEIFQDGMIDSILSFFFFILIKYSVDFWWKISRNLSRWNDRFYSSFFFFLFSLNRFYIDRRIFLIDRRFHKIFEDGTIYSIPSSFFLFSLNSQSILHRSKNIFDGWKISWNLSKWNDLFFSFFLSSLNTQSILRNLSRWNDQFYPSFFFFYSH